MSSRLSKLSSNTSGVLPSASSSVKPSSCRSFSISEQINDKSLWIFIVVAILVLIVILYIAKSRSDNSSLWNVLENFNWGVPGSIWSILMIVGIILFAWASFVAVKASISETNRYLIIGGFAISLLSLVALFSVLFSSNDGSAEDRSESHNRASWIAIFAAAVGFLVLYPMWTCSTARIAMIPYLVWITAIVVMIWNGEYLN